MGTSGNPAKKAAELKISAVGDFKRRMGGIFELPSGMVVKLKNPGGMIALVKSGMIPNSLMGVVEEALKTGQEHIEEAVLDKDGGISGEMIDTMTSLLDAVAIACVKEPEVHPLPEEGKKRDDDLLYVDELDENDKSFIFQWMSGGTADLATFRQRHTEGMASLATKSGDRGSAK